MKNNTYNVYMTVFIILSLDEHCTIIYYCCTFLLCSLGYKWSDGSAVDYTNWADNEPNNYKGNEDCVVYDYRNKWNDMNCYSTQDYICSIPRGICMKD